MSYSGRFIDAFFFLLSVVVAFAIVAPMAPTIFSNNPPPVSTTNLAPPNSVFNYGSNGTATQPTMSIFGDFWWGAAQVLKWFINVPSYWGQILEWIGMPKDWVVAIGTIIIALFGVYVIWIISNRLM